jgi:hypothetical protein
MTQNHKERAHALFSASASDRWITCPASIKMEEKYPSTTNAASEEGTKAHEIAEAILLGKPYPKDDLEMVRHGKAYADYINEIAGIDGKVYTERRVYYGGAIGQPKDLAFGTCDNIVIVPNGGEHDLHIIDYKYGFNEVSAKNNYQLMMYALGVLYNTNKYFNYIHLHIHQPRISNISTCVKTQLQLKEFAFKAEEAAKEALSPNPQFNPQPKACRWCRAKGDCKALADQTAADFEDISTDTPDTLTNDQISDILQKADTIRHFLKAVEENAFTRSLKGEDINGFKLVNKRARAKWKPEAEQRLYNDLGDKAYRKSLITITEAKKLYPIDEIVEMTDKKSEGLDLVPDSDKRPPANVAVHSDFDNLN